jgi:hypothetical protein
MKINESSIKIPKLNDKGVSYWENKGKTNKVMLYTHDDMDGIYSAVVIKKHLVDKGYEIVGYGVLNYKDGWGKTSLHPEYINVVVDFASMPDKQREHLIDIYIDHHGIYTGDEKEYYSKMPVIKTNTGSAYEGICKVLGIPTDEIVLYCIDMIDSAKYDDYGVDWKDILNFSWDRFLEIANQKGKIEIKPFKGSKSVELGYPIIAKMTFAGAFNQFLKRSDHKTLIEIIDNLDDISIYGVYNHMKRLYPGNNIWLNTGKEKDFIEDSKWRIGQMQKRSRGSGEKKIFKSQSEFYQHNSVNGELKPNGYQIIDNLVFFPSGTWANALRARSILATDYMNGIIPEDHKIDFVLLQYGNTLQVCSYDKLEGKIDNLGNYMGELLSNFKKFFGYSDGSTKVGQDELTVSGGHIGIGTISNIVSGVNSEKIFNENPNLADNIKQIIKKYDGYRYLELFKNKIISDLSNIEKWNIGMKWKEDTDSDTSNEIIRDILKKSDEWSKEELKNMNMEELNTIHNKLYLDYKVLKKDQIRNIKNLDEKNNIYTNMLSFEKFCSKTNEAFDNEELKDLFEIEYIKGELQTNILKNKGWDETNISKVDKRIQRLLYGIRYLSSFKIMTSKDGNRIHFSLYDEHYSDKNKNYVIIYSANLDITFNNDESVTFFFDCSIKGSTNINSNISEYHILREHQVQGVVPFEKGIDILNSSVYTKLKKWNTEVNKWTGKDPILADEKTQTFFN